MVELLLKPVLQFIGSLVPIAIRWYYKPERLATLVHVRLDSQGDGLEIWASNIPYCQFWIVVRNATPFELTLTGLSGRMAVGMGAADFTHLYCRPMKSGEEQRIVVRTNLNVFEFQYLHQQRPTQIQMDVAAHFSCDVNRFERTDGIRTTHIRYVNFESEPATWLPTLSSPAIRASS